MSQGTLILLNGTSSAGKSTVAKALQEIMDEPYLHSGPDHFQLAHPPGMITITDRPDTEADGWLALYGDNGLCEVRIGPLGRRMVEGVYRAMAALSDTGLNVIVDSVVAEQWSLDLAVEVLHAYPAYFVCLDLPFAVAEAREVERGDRGPGNARYFYDRVYSLSDCYDLRVDAAANDPDECAWLIKHAVETTAPAALRLLHEQDGEPTTGLNR